MKIFVSYTTRDLEITTAFLRNISYQLKAYGDVFIDLLDNNSPNKQDRVIKELETSDLLLLIETKSTYLSKWVILEMDTATSLAIPIITVPFDTALSILHQNS
jgi:hypothetical protein